MQSYGIAEVNRRGERPRIWGRRSSCAMAVLAVVASLIAGCGSSGGHASGGPSQPAGQASGGSSGGTLTIASGAPPTSLNPTLSAIAVPVRVPSRIHDRR